MTIEVQPEVQCNKNEKKRSYTAFLFDNDLKYFEYCTCGAVGF